MSSASDLFGFDDVCLSACMHEVFGGLVAEVK